MVIAIVGPTGIGKTKLSVELAKKLNGEVINGDSTQVYKRLNIGTSKVTQKEKQGIVHHLFDIVEPSFDYTVYDYQKDGRKIIDYLLNEDVTPIVVGGSGLYIKALFYDYKFMDEKKSISYEKYTTEDLYEKLISIDPESDIAKNNRQRIERALTFYEETGFPISMKESSDNLLYDVVFIGLTTDREILYKRIEKKTEIMFENGLLQEVKTLYNEGIRSSIMNSAIGYKELYEYYDNKIPLEEAIEKIKKASTNYAKRQYTWFNNQMNVEWFDVDFDNFDNTVNDVLNYIKSR